MIRYYRYGNGSVSRNEHQGDPDDFVPPVDGKEIEKEEYDRLLADLQEQHVAAKGAFLAADEDRQTDDYKVLRNVGIPHDTAARMSGYTGKPLNPKR